MREYILLLICLVPPLFCTPLSLDPPAEDSKPSSKACTTSEKEVGECVPYYLCSSQLTIIDDGEGILDLRMSACSHYLEVCCKLNTTNLASDNEWVNSVQSDMVTRRNPQTIQTTTPLNVYTTPDDLPTLGVSVDSSKDIQLPSNDKRTSCGWDNPEINNFKTKNKEVARNMQSSRIGDFPFMVAVMKRSDDVEWSPSDYIGGGALIHHRYVLTVAHRIKNYEAKDLKCRAGEYDTQTISEQYKHQDRNVKDIVIHDKYFRPSLYYDAALLSLEEAFTTAPNVGVACLAKSLPQNVPCYAMGWGKTFNNSVNALVLKKVKLELIPALQCRDAVRTTHLGRFFQLHESLTCAQGAPGVDTCKGDGGSPLVCEFDSDQNYTRYQVVGLVAYGFGCGERNLPGVYANIPTMYDWIEEQMDKNNADKPFIA